MTRDPAASEAPSSQIALANGSPQGRRLRRLDGLVALILFGVSFAMLAATATMGFTRDESFYFKYSSLYQEWFERVADDQSELPLEDQALQRDDTVGTWGQNFEHPPLMKVLFGLSWRWFANKYRPIERVYEKDGALRASLGRMTEADGFEPGDTVTIYAPLPVGAAPETAQRIGEATVLERENHRATLALSGDAATLAALKSTCAPPKDRAAVITGCRAASSGTLQIMRESSAMRMPAWLFTAALIAVLYLFGVELFGTWAGLFAALAFLVVPRQFFHAHLCSFDMPVTTLLVATVYTFWKSLRSPRWALVTALLWGVGLLTKLNAFFIPIPLLAAWVLPDAIVWAQTAIGRGRAGLRRPQNRTLAIGIGGLISTVLAGVLVGKVAALLVLLLTVAASGVTIQLPPMPRAFLIMPPVGLVMMFALWPRLWYDPAQAFYDYVNFHIGHVHYLQQYFGHILSAPPFPRSYPWMMTAMTVPVGILAVMCLGLVTLYITERKQTSLFIRVLLAANALFPIVLISMPNTPIFGGIKHWMATIAFGGLVGGHGFDWLRRRGLAWLGERARPVVAAVLLSLVLAPGAIASVRYVDVGTSYYNEAAGGLRGGAELRMHRQFWGYASALALDWVNQHAAPNSAVAFHNTTYDAYYWYQRDGVLRQDIRWKRDPSTCRPGRDLFLYHHQESFAQDRIAAWDRLETQRPVKVITIEGVPILSIYSCRGESAPATPSKTAGPAEDKPT